MSNNNNQKKRVLGKGLGALLGSAETDITSNDISGNFVAGAIAEIPLPQIEANPFQPRDQFDQEALEELCQSIKQQGIITPITVRKMGYNQYQLISGERRFRASQMAGLTNIPAYIRIANDQEMLEMALIENIQRKDLNAIEVSIGFQRLIEECSLTQEALSQRVGKDRSTITNYLRLLKLPGEIQAAVKNGKISMGHARALISLDNPEQQLMVYTEIIENSLSVRQVEEMVRDSADRPAPKKSKKQAAPEREASTDEIEKMIADKLNTEVKLKVSAKGKGSLTITFRSKEDLERIMHAIH